MEPGGAHFMGNGGSRLNFLPGLSSSICKIYIYTLIRIDGDENIAQWLIHM